MIWTVTSIAHGDIDLLPHWLKHYTAMPIDHVVLCVATDCGRTAGEVYAKAAACVPLFAGKLRIREIKMADCLTLNQHTVHTQAIRDFGADGTDWMMIADLDEIYKFPMDLLPLVDRLSGLHQPCFYGFLADMVSSTGELTAVLPDVLLNEQYPVETHITRDLLKGGDRKVMLHRAWCKVSEGHHDARPYGDPTDPRCDYPLIQGMLIGRAEHYKWRAGLRERLEAALNHHATTSERWKAEARTLIAHLDANGGKINLQQLQEPLWGPATIAPQGELLH